MADKLRGFLLIMTYAYIYASAFKGQAHHSGQSVRSDMGIAL